MKVKEGYILSCKKNIKTCYGDIIFKSNNLYKINKIINNYMDIPGESIFIAIDQRTDFEFHETEIEKFFQTSKQIRKNKLQKLNGSC